MEFKDPAADIRAWQSLPRFAFQKKGTSSLVVRARRGDVASHPSPPYTFIVAGIGVVCQQVVGQGGRGAGGGGRAEGWKRV